MAATTRTINIDLKEISAGADYASKDVTFRLETDFATTASYAVLDNEYTVTTGVDGTASAALPVPDADSWLYRCSLPDGTSFSFTLAAGAATTLHAIMAAQNLSATVSASTLTNYIHYSEVLDEDDMASDSATAVASQQSIKAYVDAGGGGALGNLSDVTITGVANNEVLAYDSGGDWINQTAAEAGLAAATHAANHTSGADDIQDATAAQKGLMTLAYAGKLDGIEASADVTDATNVNAAGAVMESDYDANTVLAATADNTPAALTVPEQTVVGRITAGNIDALTATEVRTLINVEDGADVTDATNVDAAGATMNADTDVSSNGWVVDEDNMASNLATKVPTQQSVKAYADSVVDTNEYIIIALSDETSDLVAGAAAATFRMPYAMTLSDVRASVTTAPTGSAIQVDINESASTILSTKLTIDATEKTSETAATPPVISDSALADDAEITIDIDVIGSSTAGAGLKVYLIGAR